MNAGSRWFLGWLVVCALLAAVVATAVRVSNDLGVFLPAGHGPDQRMLVDQIRRGGDAGMIIVAIGGAQPGQLARVSKRLLRHLRGDPQFTLASNGGGPLPESLRNQVFRYRYLLSDQVDPGHFTVPSLHAELRRLLDLLSAPVNLFDPQLAAADPTGEMLHLLQGWSREGPARRHGVWFDPEGRRALMLVWTAAGPFDAAAQGRARASLEGAFRQAAADSGAHLQLAGTPSVALDSARSIRHQTVVLSVLASVALALLLLLVLRRLPLLILAGVPLASGVLVAVVAVALTFGSVHGITLAFGVTLLGVAIDYPLHLFIHRREGEPPPDTARRIWPAMALGLATTLLGFSALLFSGFTGLMQLGVFAVVGLLTAGLATRYLLPRMGGMGRELRFPPLPGVPARRVLGAAAMLLPLLAAGYLAWHPPVWQSDLAALSPMPRAVKEREVDLRSALGVDGSRYLLVVAGADRQTVLEACEDLRPALDRLAGSKALGGYELVTRYLPSRRAQLQRRNALPEPDILKQRLVQAIDGLPFRTDVFQPFFKDVAWSRQATPLLPGTDLAGPLRDQVGRLLVRRGEGWAALVPLRGVTAIRPLRALAAESGGRVRFVDLKQQTEDMIAAYRDAALVQSGWGALAILVVLLVMLRRPRRVAAVAWSGMGSVLMVVALLTLLGKPLSIFHLVTLLLVVGLGIDYGVFATRPEDDDHGAKSAYAVMVCAASTILVFGLLATSSVPVLHAIGLTAACGSLFAMLLAFAGAATQRVGLTSD